jgi:hypothetical protein
VHDVPYNSDVVTSYLKQWPFYDSFETMSWTITPAELDIIDIIKRIEKSSGADKLKPKSWGNFKPVLSPHSD